MSNIEWTEQTWNPVVGCTPVSPGCDLCYAGVLSHRLAAMGQAAYVGLTVKRKAPGRAGGKPRSTFNGTVRCLPDRLDIPVKRKKPTMYFVNSMSDLFHKKVPFEFVDKVFAVMALCPQHTFQVLTKRPERMAEYLNTPQRAGQIQVGGADWLAGPEQKPWPGTEEHHIARVTDAHRRMFREWKDWPLPNVWLGTSVEDQARADERIPHLLRCPAAVRFLSCEPLLGPIDLQKPHGKIGDNGEFVLAQGYGDPRMLWACPKCQGTRYFQTDPQAIACSACRGTGVGIHWVICGGESGPGARPSDLQWHRSIRNQCRGVVPFFEKQLGSHVYDSGPGGPGHRILLDSRKGSDMGWQWPVSLRVREMPKEHIA